MQKTSLGMTCSRYAATRQYSTKSSAIIPNETAKEGYQSTDKTKKSVWRRIYIIPPHRELHGSRESSHTRCTNRSDRKVGKGEDVAQYSLVDHFRGAKPKGHRGEHGQQHFGTVGNISTVEHEDSKRPKSWLHPRKGHRQRTIHTSTQAYKGAHKYKHTRNRHREQHTHAHDKQKTCTESRKARNEMSVPQHKAARQKETLQGGSRRGVVLQLTNHYHHRQESRSLGTRDKSAHTEA